MSELDPIININISLATTTAESAGFGVPLILVETSDIAERVKAYTTLAGVADDFASSTNAYKLASAVFSQELKPEKLLIGRADTGETLTDELNAVIAADDTWYCLISEKTDKASILELAAVIETQEKIFIARSSDAAIGDAVSTTDIAYELEALSRLRTGVIWHKAAATNYVDAALAGRQLPTDVGSTTWAFKQLSGIVASAYSESERTAALAKNANIYEKRAGVSFLFDGKMADGNYIDTVRGRDWIKAKLQEELFNRLIRPEKVPYTQKGIEAIGGLVRNVLKRAETQGIIRDDFTVNVPLLADIPLSDKANRILPNVNFTATFASAIHTIKINGVIGA